MPGRAALHVNAKDSIMLLRLENEDAHESDTSDPSVC